MRSKELEKAIEKLQTSTTEEEIIKNLTKILKEFNVSLYKNLLLSNPYYKSLIVDVKEDVEKEILIIRESIVNEITEIDSEIRKSNKHSDKLKELKRDCVALLYEIDERSKEIGKLI